MAFGTNENKNRDRGDGFRQSDGRNNPADDPRRKEDLRGENDVPDQNRRKESKDEIKQNEVEIARDQVGLDE